MSKYMGDGRKILQLTIDMLNGKKMKESMIEDTRAKNRMPEGELNDYIENTMISSLDKQSRQSSWLGKNKINKRLPKIINLMSSLAPSTAIIGSFAEPFKLDKIPHQERDIDVVIAPNEWSAVAPYIPKNATVNTFGGWKFETDEGIVDIWPDNVISCATAGRTEYIYIVRNDILYTKK